MDKKKVGIRTIAASGSNLFAGSWGSGVFLSTDNGASWIAVNNGLTSTSIFSLGMIGTNLFAGAKNGGGVFRSTDNGKSWTVVNNGLTNTKVNTLAVSGKNLLAGTEGGAFLSTDNGLNWTEIGLAGTDVCAFAISGTNLLVGTYKNGIFRRPITEIIDALKVVK